MIEVERTCGATSNLIILVVCIRTLCPDKLLSEPPPVIDAMRQQTGDAGSMSQVEALMMLCSPRYQCNTHGSLCNGDSSASAIFLSGSVAREAIRAGGEE